MAVTRLSGGSTPANGSDPRTFPAIWNDTAEQIEQAQNDIDALESSVGTAEADINALESNLGLLQGTVVSAQSDISNLQSALGTAQSDITVLQGAVGTAQADIFTLQGTAISIQYDLDLLEASAVTIAAGTPVDGNSLVYSTASGGWIPGVGGGGGGASVTIGTATPGTATSGDMFWDSDNGNLYIYYDDGNTSQWVAANGPQMVVSDIAPAGYQGQLWFDSSQGQMFVYYEDVDSAQWVSANGPQVLVSEVQPDGYQGQLWFDSTQGKTYIYYDDGTSAQWVSAIGGSLAGNVIQVVSTTKTDTFSTTSTSFTDVTGLSATITPKFSTSKIMISVNMGHVDLSAVDVMMFQLVRGSTAIAIGDTAGSRTRASFAYVPAAGDRGTSAAIGFLDSPSTTSATTYKVQMRVNSGTGVVNRRSSDVDSSGNPRVISTITLMEIAG